MFDGARKRHALPATQHLPTPPGRNPRQKYTGAKRSHQSKENKGSDQKYEPMKAHCKPIANPQNGFPLASCWVPCHVQTHAGPSPALLARGAANIKVPLPAFQYYGPASLQHPDTGGATVRASHRQHRPDVHLRTHGLRFRPHRQFPHLRFL